MSGYTEGLRALAEQCEAQADDWCRVAVELRNPNFVDAETCKVLDAAIAWSKRAAVIRAAIARATNTREDGR